jgi:serine/threonine protein kinase
MEPFKSMLGSSYFLDDTAPLTNFFEELPTLAASATASAPLGQLPGLAIIGYLGSGGFAHVLLARSVVEDHAKVNHPYRIVKVLRSSLSKFASQRSLFKREGERGLKINGKGQIPNLPTYVAVKEFEEDSVSIPYIVQIARVPPHFDPATSEPLATYQGRSLAQVLDSLRVGSDGKLRRVRFRECAALAVILQAAKAVNSLHSVNPKLVHNDLQPGNLLLAPLFCDLLERAAIYDTQDVTPCDTQLAHFCSETLHSICQDGVIVLDLGLTVEAGSSLQSAVEGDSTLFHATEDVGVVEYVAPEVFAALAADSNKRFKWFKASPFTGSARSEIRSDTRSDIYSLGALLFELLTGGPPFAGNRSTVPLLQQKYDPFFTDKLECELSLEVRQICMTALSRELCFRYSDSAMLLEDLKCASCKENSEAAPSEMERGLSRLFSRQRKSRLPNARGMGFRKWAIRSTIRHPAAAILISTTFMFLTVSLFYGWDLSRKNKAINDQLTVISEQKDSIENQNKSLQQTLLQRDIRSSELQERIFGIRKILLSIWSRRALSATESYTKVDGQGSLDWDTNTVSELTALAEVAEPVGIEKERTDFILQTELFHVLRSFFAFYQFQAGETRVHDFECEMWPLIERLKRLSKRNETAKGAGVSSSVPEAILLEAVVDGLYIARLLNDSDFDRAVHVAGECAKLVARYHEVTGEHTDFGKLFAVSLADHLSLLKKADRENRNGWIQVVRELSSNLPIEDKLTVHAIVTASILDFTENDVSDPIFAEELKWWNEIRGNEDYNSVAKDKLEVVVAKLFVTIANVIEGNGVGARTEIEFCIGRIPELLSTFESLSEKSKLRTEGVLRYSLAWLTFIELHYFSDTERIKEYRKLERLMDRKIKTGLSQEMLELLKPFKALERTVPKKYQEMEDRRQDEFYKGHIRCLSSESEFFDGFDIEEELGRSNLPALNLSIARHLASCLRLYREKKFKDADEFTASRLALNASSLLERISGKLKKHGFWDDRLTREFADVLGDDAVFQSR